MLQAFEGDQVRLIKKAYTQGAIYDVGASLAAIVVIESSAGRHTLSPDEQDCGVAQINLTSFKLRYQQHLQHFPLSDAQICNMLIRDVDLNLLAAIEELRFWREVHHDNWRLVWGSYNGGWTPNTEYAAKVARMIKTLRKEEIIP